VIIDGPESFRRVDNVDGPDGFAGFLDVVPEDWENRRLYAGLRMPMVLELPPAPQRTVLARAGGEPPVATHARGRDAHRR
jgi:hypothetical protein